MTLFQTSKSYSRVSGAPFHQRGAVTLKTRSQKTTTYYHPMRCNVVRVSPTEVSSCASRYACSKALLFSDDLFIGCERWQSERIHGRVTVLDMLHYLCMKAQTVCRLHIIDVVMKQSATDCFILPHHFCGFIYYYLRVYDHLVLFSP